MQKLTRLSEFEKISLDIGTEQDFNKSNSDGTTAHKLVYYLPRDLITRLNIIIDNLNEITESKIARSIMNLEKGADEEL